MTDQTFSIPVDFSAKEHLQRMAEEWATSNYRVAVGFDSDIAHMVREPHEEWQQRTKHEDGCVTLAFDASDLAWPCRRVLAYQDRAKVVGHQGWRPWSGTRREPSPPATWIATDESAQRHALL